MVMNRFSISRSESTIYTKVNPHGQILNYLLYVGYIIFTDNLSIDELKVAMKKELR